MSDFVSVADLAVFLDSPITDLDAALASLAVAAAQQRVRKYLNQVITYVANDIALFDGNGKFRLRLKERPVRAVALVEEENADGETWDALEAVTWRLKRDVLVRQDGIPWFPGYANLRITYSHGWNAPALDSDTSDSDFDTDQNNLPADISLATLSLARRMFENLGTQAGAGTIGNIKQETIGSYSYTLSSAAEAAAAVQLNKAELAVLDDYREEGAG